MGEERKTHARCLYCGAEFEHHIPKKVLDEHKNALLIVQLFCSPQCEHESQRELEKERLEREKQNTTFKEKFCPLCKFVPNNWKYRELAKCPYCHVPFEYREVIRWQIREKEWKKEYQERKKREKHVAENVI